MIEIRNSILHQNHGSRIWTNIFCMAFGIFWGLSGQALAGAPEKKILNLNQTASELKPYAVALGQRLQRPGKERITAIGTIAYLGDALQQTEPVRIIWQYPLKIRLDQGQKSLTFDRDNPAESALKDRQNADTIQMLLEDTVEGFFAIQKEHISRRHLGSGFKLEGASASDAGVDIVVIAYPDIFRQKQPIQKSYWFDSCTKLLGVVAYTSPAGVLTHIVIDDWRDIEGEKIPFRIERWETNKLKMRLSLDSAAVSGSSGDSNLGGN